MKLKLKGRHFENIEEIRAELQDGMKMLAQNDLKQWFRSGVAVLTKEEATSKDMEANKVSVSGYA
jgi:hypothetical protein